jgi:hypothetical protein
MNKKSNITKYIQHDFKDEIQNCVFSFNQLKIFDILNKHSTRLHVLEGTPRSGKTLFWKYFTHYFQTQNKNLLLTTTTRGSAL